LEKTDFKKLPCYTLSFTGWTVWVDTTVAVLFEWKMTVFW
jgi:hypothetical protein